MFPIQTCEEQKSGKVRHYLEMELPEIVNSLEKSITDEPD